MKKYFVLVLLLLFISAGVAIATPVQWSVNGHYYERIDIGVTWDEANTAANAMTYAGFQGHLVTITSAAENMFLTNDANLGGGQNLNLLHYHWTGGYQPAYDVREPSGGWAWVTGEAFNSYNNWAGGEPNDSNQNEDYLVFDHGFSTDGKQWNDLNGNSTTSGYVVEYESTGTPSVPEPATLLLFGLGLLGLVPLRQKMK